jgi:hypothetical protein
MHLLPHARHEKHMHRQQPAAGSKLSITSFVLFAKVRHSSYEQQEETTSSCCKTSCVPSMYASARLFYSSEE